MEYLHQIIIIYFSEGHEYFSMPLRNTACAANPNNPLFLFLFNFQNLGNCRQKHLLLPSPQCLLRRWLQMRDLRVFLRVIEEGLSHIQVRPDRFTPLKDISEPHGFL